jgi:thiamine biosynthesis lipoprotein
MACRVEVALTEGDVGHLAAATEALNEADRVEALLTVFRDSSELSRLNREAASGASEVDEEVLELLTQCEQLHAETDGAFDITSTPLSRCWGFLQRNGRIPPLDEIEAARARVGMRRVTLDRAARHVRFDLVGMELNLGAIGKGYALDRMGELLRRRGLRHALLSAGGSSVRAIGGRGTGWTIDIRSPLVDRTRLARLYLRDGALGTSGIGEQFVIDSKAGADIAGESPNAGSTRYGHVIDPRTGWPAQGVLSASVVAANAARADALSTAFLVGGPELACQYCDDHPNTLALLVLDDGTARPQVWGHHDGAMLMA